MKIAPLVFIFSSVALNTFGQVSGNLTTSDGKPLPFANVLVLYANDSTLAQGTLTTESGHYAIGNIPVGQYFLRYSAIGYHARESGLFAVSSPGESHHFNTQILEEAIQQLDEVVVQADRPLYQQGPNGVIINVESSVMTKGSSALQVLERSPGVYVNHRTGSLSLNGNSGVMVMLNGKIMRLPIAQVMAMLNGMSANDIEKIELLATPPSRYDADGSAGLINIVFKKRNDLGITGSASATAGFGWGVKANASASFSQNTGRMSFYGSYSLLRDRSKDGWAAYSTQDMPAFGGALSVDVSSQTKSISAGTNAMLGLDLHLKNTTVGGSITYNASHIANDIVNQGAYTILESDSLLRMEATIDGKRRWHNGIANLYMEKRLREGERLNADVEYLHFVSESPTGGYTSFFDREGNEAIPEGSIFSGRQRGVSNSPIQVGVVNVHYTRSVGRMLEVEAGVKGTLTRSESLSRIETLSNGEWTSSRRYMNDVDMNEQIGAVYSSFQLQITPSARVTAGLRYEYSHTYSNSADNEDNNLDRKLGMLFPTFIVSKKVNDASEFQLSYTKRISRPSYNDLASYLLYNDPMSVSTGNPSLRPTVTHNLRVGYVVKGYSFSLLAGRDNYPIILNQQKESPQRDLMYLAPQNMAYQKNVILQAGFPVTVTRNWTMNYGWVGRLSQFKLDHTDDKITKTYFAYSLTGSQTFALPGKFSLEISGWYNSFQYEGSKKIDRFGMLNAGLKKELNKNMGTIQLSLTDLFKSMRVSGYFGELTKEAFSLKAHYVYKAESARNRIVKLTYTYSFGNSAAKAKSSRGTVSGDERGRIRK